MSFKTLPLKAPDIEADINCSWRGSEVVVSIICATYQHGKYIEDAISGFLSQRTNFPFEIIIRDDASADGAADIITRYAEKFPSIMVAIIENTNQYPNVEPGKVMGELARGKYLAFCDGDDYWTDPLKLQKQVDLMELRPDIVLSYHSFVNILDGESTFKIDDVNEPIGELLTSPRTCTRMIRNHTDKFPAKLFPVPNYDQAIKFVLEDYGKASLLPDVLPSVRRVHAGGVMSAVGNLERARRRYKTWSHVAEVYKGSQRFREANAKKNLARISLLRLLIRKESSFTACCKLRFELFQVCSLPSVILRIILRTVRRLLFKAQLFIFLKKL